MKKTLKGGLLTLLVMLPCFLNMAFAEDIRILINDKPIELDAAPLIENDRVLVPMRGVLESLGYAVRWDETAQTASAMKGGLRITLPLGSNIVSVNGKAVEIDAPAKIYGARTYVPLRFLAEYSGAQVLWDGASSTVSIHAEVDTEEDDLRDSVVMIQTNKIMGSGVILSEDGLIATNFHVIENASVAVIMLNDNSIYSDDVTVVGLNPEADLALLKINLDGLTPAESSHSISVGEKVTAIGSPGGDLNKITTGEILSFDQDMIASTAEIARGSSGGGLFNAEGKLIGISAAMGNEQYLSIPIALVEKIPQNLSIPIAEMPNYVYRPHAPENLRYRMEDGYAYISWSPIYGAAYFLVEVAPYENGPFSPLTSSASGKNYWYWGHPQCFGVSMRQGQSTYLRVTAVVNGARTETSNVLKISNP